MNDALIDVTCGLKLLNGAKIPGKAAIFGHSLFIPCITSSLV